MRKVTLTAAVVTALVASAVVAAPATAGKRGDPIAARPVPGSQVDPKGSFYLLNANPGDVVTQSIRVTNPNKHQVQVSVEPVDASTSDTTGVAYGQPGSAKALTGRWVSVSTPLVTLQPDEHRDILFTVRVPKDVTAGQYLAGVSSAVLLSNADKQADSQAGRGQAGFSLSEQLQRAIAVEVDVPGARAPKMTVSGVEPKAVPDGVALGIHMANDGNAFAKGTAVVRVPDTGTDATFPVDTFLPHTAIVYPLQWTKRVVSGLHHVQVDITYGDGLRTSWSGTVNIAGDLKNQLENGLHRVQPRSHHSNLLWLILGGIVAVALIFGARRMRRRGRPQYVGYRTA